MFIGATELILLLCVPFMLRTRRSREHFVALLSSASNLVKFGVLLLIGLIGIVLYVFGLGRGHPIVIAAVLNLDPFWAAIIAYLAAGKKIPTSFLTFTLCLIVSFVGAMLLAVSQTDADNQQDENNAPLQGALRVANRLRVWRRSVSCGSAEL